MLYAALLAVVLVHVILGFWIFTATKEDREVQLKKQE